MYLYNMENYLKNYIHYEFRVGKMKSKDFKLEIDSGMNFCNVLFLLNILHTNNGIHKVIKFI